MEISFYNGPNYTPRKRINVNSCPCLAHQNYHDGYHNSREGTESTKCMLRKNKLGLVILIYLILPTVIQKPGLRHIHYYQYWYSFSVNQTIQAACQNADWKDPKSRTIRTMVGYTLMWDGFMWLIFGYRHLRTQPIPY